MIKRTTLRGKDLVLIVLVAVMARILWALLSGLGPEEGVDFSRWDHFSDSILQGDLNLETTVIEDPDLDTRLFIAAPLYPYALAVGKLVFGRSWFAGLGIIQILISSASAACLAATADLIFRKRTVAITAGLLYAVYLPTLYFTHLPSQESLFQSFFVIAFFGLCQYNEKLNWQSILFFSIFFTLALLTKSHVILMVPLVIVLIVLRRSQPIKTIAHAAIFLGILGLMTMPYGLYNLQANQIYVVSSSGSGGHCLTGNNNDFYQWLIQTPLKGSAEYKRLADMRFTAFSKKGIAANASHEERQSIYLKRGLDWVIANPWKALNLRIHNLLHHLQPGYSLRFHSWRNWGVALAFNLPIYILAYIELLRHLSKPRHHLPAYLVFIAMILFVLIFYSQNRFRLITIEPVYVLYAAPGCVSIGSWIRQRMRERCLNLQS